MEEGVKLTDMFPDLVAEIKDLLIQERREDLLPLLETAYFVKGCNCSDDFCTSFFTRSTTSLPNGQHETVALNPKVGMINLDVSEGQLTYVELLYRT